MEVLILLSSQTTLDCFRSPLLSLPFLTHPSSEEQEVLGVLCGYCPIFTISISAFCPLSKFLQIPLFHCSVVQFGFHCGAFGTAHLPAGTLS